jgi:hypothetical protein
MKSAPATTKPDKPDGSDLRRTFRQELRRLCRLAKQSPGHKKVHTLRKGIVQLRSWLRLVRTEIGEAEFHRHNRRLRQAARQLAPARDARVWKDTLEKLGTPARFPQTAARLKRQVKRTRQTLPGALRRVRKRLREELAKSDRLPFKKITHAQLVLALERLHRETEAARAAAGADRSNQNLHAWRKRLKNELQALAFVAGMKTPSGAITQLLGEDHDLALLAEAANAWRDPRESPRLCRQIAARRARLQAQLFPQVTRRPR